MSYTLASILPRAAARLNDYAQTSFTNASLLPYAQDAGDELQLALEKAGMLVLEKKNSSPIVVAINDITLTNPLDMLEPQLLKERLSGSSDLYTPMTRRMWTPDILPTDSLRYWDYREETLHFIGATSVRDVIIHYLKRAINITAITDSIAVNNSQQFMINRIAGLAARFIGENQARADVLDGIAGKCLEDLTGIGIKNKQGTRTRRRPFIIQARRRWS